MACGARGWLWRGLAGAYGEALVWCRTLQGNWYEDREQNTIGTNDGLRCMDVAYKEMMDGQVCAHADLPSCPCPH